METGLDWATPKQLRGPAYHHLTRGVYTAAGRERTYEELIRAMRVILPSNAVLSGRSAAWALGVHRMQPDDPVEIILPPTQRVRNREKLLVRGDVLPSDEVIDTPLGLVTSGARTAFDLGRLPRVPVTESEKLLRQLSTRKISGLLPTQGTARLCNAVALVDAVLRATGATVESVARLASRHVGARGSSMLRVVLALADPRAESLPESIVRTRIILGGLPWPVPQYQVLGRQGEFVARVDLAWPAIRLAAEYDGAYHDEKGQIARDRDRDLRLHLAGWRPIHLDRSHLNAADELLRIVRAAVLL